MKSLISEFSYGFALTHELVIALGSLSAAPIFPSLIEEGRTGGGYDVKLEAPGIPLFLQFKRSECLQMRNAREIRAGARLNVPFYRCEITGKRDSRQHEMLIDLDQAPNRVFYAAPMFHQKDEFDAAFLSGTVRQRSFFVRPRSIGSFSDDRPHHLSFDGSRCIVMSEPKEIEALGAADLESMLAAQLAEDKRPLRAVAQEALNEAEAARDRSRDRIDRIERRAAPRAKMASSFAASQQPRRRSRRRRPSSAGRKREFRQSAMPRCLSIPTSACCVSLPTSDCGNSMLSSMWSRLRAGTETSNPASTFHRFLTASNTSTEKFSAADTAEF